MGSTQRLNETMKNNPAFLSEEAIVAGFSARRAEFELIVEALTESVDSPANRHMLVVGARGTGKTTLVHRVAAEIRRSEALSQHWYPVVLPEESYEVLSAGELWLMVIGVLMHDPRAGSLAEIYQSLHEEPDPARLRVRAIARIAEVADAMQRRMVIVVENLNMLFDQQLSDDDAWELRKTLQTEPRVLILATATSRFAQIERSDKALFDMFRVHHLEPLTPDDARTMWTRLTGHDPGSERIRAVHILTGGNPRLLTIMAGFAGERSFRELLIELLLMVDEYTAYFKANIDALPAQERKVFITLADLWEPSTTARVAERARLPVNKVSAQLRRLVQRGAVVEAKREGRRIWYQVAERLYNIYHLMRRRGPAAGRVRALVEFMLAFYAPPMLNTRITRLVEEAGECTREERRDVLAAFAQLLIRHPDPETRAPLLSRLAEFIRESRSDLSPKLTSHPEVRRAMGEIVTTKDILTRRMDEIGEGNQGWASLMLLAMVEAGFPGAVDLGQGPIARLPDPFPIIRSTPVPDSPTPFQVVILTWLSSASAGLTAIARLLRRPPGVPLESEDMMLTVAACSMLVAKGRETELCSIFGTPGADKGFEPLAVALRLECGEEVEAPLEIMEVATDIRQEFTAQRERMNRSSPREPTPV